MNCQLCGEEKRKLIVDGHAWDVEQMTWTAIANSVPTVPFFPNIPCVGFEVSILASFKC